MLSERKGRTHSSTLKGEAFDLRPWPLCLLSTNEQVYLIAEPLFLRPSARASALHPFLPGTPTCLSSAAQRRASSPPPDGADRFQGPTSRKHAFSINTTREPRRRTIDKIAAESRETARASQTHCGAALRVLRTQHPHAPHMHTRMYEYISHNCTLEAGRAHRSPLRKTSKLKNRAASLYCTMLHMHFLFSSHV